MSEPRADDSGEATCAEAFLDTAYEGRIATITLNRRARRSALSVGRRAQGQAELTPWGGGSGAPEFFKGT